MDYAKDIKVIFKERCVSCHGSVKQKGGLRLDAGALILKGGKHPVVEPGNSSRSALMERVLSADEEERDDVGGDKFGMRFHRDGCDPVVHDEPPDGKQHDDRKPGEQHCYVHIE